MGKEPRDPKIKNEGKNGSQKKKQVRESPVSVSLVFTYILTNDNKLTA